MKHSEIESLIKKEPNFETELKLYYKRMEKVRLFNLILMISLPEVLVHKIRLYLHGSDYGYIFLKGERISFSYYKQLTHSEHFSYKNTTKFLRIHDVLKQVKRNLKSTKRYGTPSKGTSLGLFFNMFRLRKIQNSSNKYIDSSIKNYYEEILNYSHAKISGMFPRRPFYGKNLLNMCLLSHEDDKEDMIEFLHNNRIIPMRRKDNWFLLSHKNNLSKKQKIHFLHGLKQSQCHDYHKLNNPYMVLENTDYLSEINKNISCCSYCTYINNIPNLWNYNRKTLVRILLSF